ncbi:hypothetical protein Ddc_04666 [Ditylenchus destructor]|nr:hypothetical protein Ddc_04666 [Ditylenchus destructor]
MRHLAARFIKTAGKVVHVVDPYLDLRTIFRDTERLSRNIASRGLNIDLQKTAEEYSNWWNAFKTLSLNENTDVRRDLRDKVLTRENGLLDALRLPNFLLPDFPFDSDLFANSSKASQKNFNHEFDCSTLGLSLTNRLNDFALSSLDPPALPLAPPYMVRPAVVEACNMDCEDFPIVNDGPNNPRLILTGISLPSTVACFLSHCLTDSKDRRLPLCFSSFGTSYFKNKGAGIADNANPFMQRHVYSIVCVTPIDEQNCVKGWASQVQAFLAEFFKSIGASVECSQVTAPNLLLCEGSAISFNALKPDGDCQTMLEVARISNLGDYVSRRANIKIENKSNADFAQMFYLQVDISNIVNLLTSTKI